MSSNELWLIQWWDISPFPEKKYLHILTTQVHNPHLHYNLLAIQKMAHGSRMWWASPLELCLPTVPSCWWFKLQDIPLITFLSKAVDLEYDDCYCLFIPSYIHSYHSVISFDTLFPLFLALFLLSFAFHQKCVLNNSLGSSVVYLFWFFFFCVSCYRIF